MIFVKIEGNNLSYAVASSGSGAKGGKGATAAGGIPHGRGAHRRRHFAHEPLERGGGTEVVELEDESPRAEVDVGDERAGDLVGRAGHDATPAAEPSLRQRADLVAVGVTGGQADRVLNRHARVPRQLSHLRQPVGRVRGAVPPVGELAHERQRELRARAADVYRDSRLHRDGTPDGPGQPVMRTRVVERLAREHAREDLERLAQTGGALGRQSGVDPEGAQLGVDRAPTETELEPSVTEHVERRRHLRQHRRVAERIARHEVAESDPARARREPGGECPALERVPFGRGGGGEVVHQPHRVEPGCFGRQRPIEDRVERHAQLREEQPEPHPDVAVSRHAGTLPSRSRRLCRPPEQSRSL
jgi:hypothetical protein